jgi:hypothetical protein
MVILFMMFPLPDSVSVLLKAVRTALQRRRFLSESFSNAAAVVSDLRNFLCFFVAIDQPLSVNAPRAGTLNYSFSPVKLDG